MKKEITVRGIISEINVDKELGVVIKQNNDGTADFIIKFENSNRQFHFQSLTGG